MKTIRALQFRSVALAAVGLTWLAGTAPAAAQGSTEHAVPPESGSTAQREFTVPPASLGETVAIVPWNYRNSRDAAIQSAHEVCSQLLLGTGFNVYLIRSASSAMPPPMSGISGSKTQQSAFSQLLTAGRNLVTQDAPGKATSAFVLPTREEMVSIGARFHPRYVLAGRAQWRSKNVWIGVSNRIKSICTVDLRILDMNTGRLVLDARGVEGDSTENKNLYNSFTNIMAFNPLPLVMPGSIGPYEQRAVTVAISRAVHPWLKAERIRAALAQADASGLRGGRFSSLLSPIKDLQAALHVVPTAGKTVDLGDKDLNRLAGLRDVMLQSLEPDRLRLSAFAPKQGEETLLFLDDTRSFTAGKGKTPSRQDISGSPMKRLSLFEICGILTPGIFDTMRARFVRSETLGGVPTLVYDLTYWGLEDGAYHRVWIDPAKRLILKRQLFDVNSKLKTITLYRRPAEAAPGIYLPENVVVEDSTGKQTAEVTISGVKADRSLPQGTFAIPAP